MAFEGPYPIPTEPATTFNFSTIAEGTGVVTFYAASMDQASASYVLTQSQIFSNAVYSSGAAIGSSAGDSLDIDFDLTKFNKARNLRGTAIATIPWAYELTPSGDASYAIHVFLQKVDKNSNVETIASGACVQRIQSGAGTKLNLSTIKIPIPTIKRFRKGDTLRARILGRIGGSSGTSRMSIAHDPKNRTEDGYTSGTAIETTTLSIDVPLDVETG